MYTFYAIYFLNFSYIISKLQVTIHRVGSEVDYLASIIMHIMQHSHSTIYNIRV